MRPKKVPMRIAPNVLSNLGKLAGPGEKAEVGGEAESDMAVGKETVYQ